MLILHFAGYFQCRVPTDPDPCDDPRGASGFNFAMAGEPDLDRIIRFQNPVAPRSHGPAIGVFVTSVTLDGQVLPDHPLVGASVDLLGEPKFESRNYVLRDGSQGPIVPFVLRVAGGGVAIEREDILYPPDPGRKLHEIPTEFLARRGSWIALIIDRVRIADATGIVDPLAYRARRKALLQEDLAKTEDPTLRTALEKRISQLSITDPKSLQVATLVVHNDYRFDILGPTKVEDPEGKLGAAIDGEAEWPIAFWMGAWDADALAGHVRGLLSIPTLAARPHS